MKTLYVLGSLGYASPFVKMFQHIVPLISQAFPGKNTEIPDLLLFTGGQDISRHLYDASYSEVYLQQRCEWEREWFLWAVQNKVSMFGTCRGMQFFTAMTGGKLIQHVDGHFGEHSVTDSAGNRFKVNSIHHQMCLPKSGSAVLLAYAYNIIKNKQVPENPPIELAVGPAGDFVEPEALYFPSVNALGVQWHPEGMSANSEAHKWVMGKVYEYLHLQ